MYSILSSTIFWQESSSYFTSSLIGFPNFHGQDNFRSSDDCFQWSCVYRGSCIFQFECVRHLNERIGEHSGILHFTKKKVKPKNSSVSNHLLFCNDSSSFDNFGTVTPWERKAFAEIERKPVDDKKPTFLE